MFTLAEMGATFGRRYALAACREVGCEGLLVPDHLPRVEGDSPYQHRSRAYATPGEDGRM